MEDLHPNARQATSRKYGSTVTGTSTKCGCDGDLPISRGPASGATHYPLTDALGSIYAVTDSSGNVVATWNYDVFGARTQSSGTLHLAYGYTGKEHDADTGFILQGQRYRDPSTGGWLQPDRLTFAYEHSLGRKAEPLGVFSRLPRNLSEANYYAYVDARPTMETDPSGLFSWPGYNVEWWEPGTPEGDALQEAYNDVVSNYWPYSIFTNLFSNACLGGADLLAADLKSKTQLPFYFTISVAALSTFAPPAPPFPIHYYVLLTPIPPSQFGRVTTDAYLWPSMNDLWPEDAANIRDY
jgi:RHS repeat-associated protein